MCGTCSSPTVCINACNSDCKTCLVNQTCDSCVDGKYLASGSCETCDNTACATC